MPDPKNEPAIQELPPLDKVEITGAGTQQALDAAQSLRGNDPEVPPTYKKEKNGNETSADIVDQARQIAQGSTVGDGTFTQPASTLPKNNQIEELNKNAEQMQEAAKTAELERLKLAEAQSGVNQQNEKVVTEEANKTTIAQNVTSNLETTTSSSSSTQTRAGSDREQKIEQEAAVNIYTGNVIEKGDSAPVTVTGVKISDSKSVHTDGSGSSGKPPEVFITKHDKVNTEVTRDSSPKDLGTSPKAPSTSGSAESTPRTPQVVISEPIQEKPSQSSVPVKNSNPDNQQSVESYKQPPQTIKSETQEKTPESSPRITTNQDVIKQPPAIESVQKAIPVQETQTESKQVIQPPQVDSVPRRLQNDHPVPVQKISTLPPQEPKIIDGGLSLESVRQRLLEQKLQDFKEQITRPAVEQRLEKQESKASEPRLSTDRVEKIKATNAESTDTSTQQRRNVETQNTKQVIEATTTKNFVDVAKTLTKSELIKTISEAIKTALSEGKITKLSEIVKAAIIDPKVREAVKTIIQSSSGGSGSGKPAIPTELAKVKVTDSEKVKLPLDRAKSIEAITQPVTTKQEAMQVLLGLIVDASKLQNPVVQAVQAETVSKLQTIQSSIDELLKLRVEQFVALSSKAHGVDGATIKMLCNEALQELATRYGLTDEQRAMLSRIMIQLHETDFHQDQDPSKPKTSDQNELEKQNQKDLKQPDAKVLSKQELEKLFQEELVQLEEFLKERDEVKLKRAQEKLEALLQEVAEEGTNFVIDEDFEVIKTYTIEGIVLEELSGKPLPYTHIYGGILGKITTDEDGKFAFYNIPQETAYMIGTDKIGYQFKPELVTGTLQTSVQLKFIGIAIQ